MWPLLHLAYPVPVHWGGEAALSSTGGGEGDVALLGEGG